MSCYQKALEIKPDYHMSLDNMGFAYNKLGKYDKAIKCHEEALSLKPDCYNAFYNLSCIHFLKYGKSVKKDPANPSEDDLKKALEFLKKAVEGDEKFRELAKTDKDFEVIRDNPRFKEIVGDI